MPSGWEEAARSEGALQRSRRIKTPEDLLTLNLLYLTGAGSFQNASTLMTLGADIRVNKEAARKRIQNSWQWLRWMGHKLCLEQGYAIERPEWIGDRRALLVDASDTALRGSITSDYRLHYAFDLFEYTCAQMELTTIAQGGEKLSRYIVKPGDIVVADRIYGTIKGMEHIRAAGASFLVRLRTKAFILYNEDGERMEILPQLRALKPWEPFSLNCFYKNTQGQLCPVRIVATRKDEPATKKADRRLSKTAIRKQLPPATSHAQEMAGYIVLATNLPDTPAQILELYRARWQIERVFLRLKELFAIGEPPCTHPDSVKAWFYGKLFVAALCEAMTRKASFSP